MKQYKDEKSLEKLSSNELEIMIRTTEYKIQEIIGSKGIFSSILSILFALIIVVISSDDDIGLKIITVVLYIIIISIYLFGTIRTIDKWNEYLSTLRYVKENK